jgi:hypothetical protein
MTIRKINTLLAILALCFYSTTNSNYDELVFLGDWKTIKELKQNIDTLDKINDNLEDEFKQLNTTYELKTFLKKSLSSIDIKRIKALIAKYNDSKDELEKVLLKKAKQFSDVINEQKQLLEVKREFYSWLSPYINIKYKVEYLEYIKWDTKIFNKQKSITTDIIVKKEILNNKVETIETKIQKHKEYIDDSVKKITEARLDEKIRNLANNPSFKWLIHKSKLKVLDKTIDKIEAKILKLEESKVLVPSWAIMKPFSSILNKKIQTYYIAIEKLEAFKNSIK